jgi:hypothetical protein
VSETDNSLVLGFMNKTTEREQIRGIRQPDIVDVVSSNLLLCGVGNIVSGNNYIGLVTVYADKKKDE